MIPEPDEPDVMGGLNQIGVLRHFRHGDRQRGLRGQIGVYANGFSATTGSQPPWKATLDAAACPRMPQEGVTKVVSWRCVMPPRPVTPLAAAVERGATQRLSVAAKLRVSHDPSA